LDKKKVVFIDTNVFIIDLRYRNDRNFKINRDPLDLIARHGKDSIYKLGCKAF